jgi:hypothetical protein
MSEVSVPERKTPWHVWVVAVLTLLWNGLGAYVIMMAQAGRFPDLNPEELAYYAAQPLWFVIATDVAVLAPLAAGVALLLRHRAAVVFFAVSLTGIVITDVYDVAAGSSRALVNQAALIATMAIAAIAVLQFVYAWRMRKRFVLR